ncbi:MAG: hypothetical protein WCW40_09060 [Bacteroidota bacterium]
MKTFIGLLISVAVFFNILLSQPSSPVSTPEITIKISEKSGFFGMGKPRFAKIALSTRNQDNVLNSDNVNSGPLYYFMMRDSGGWSMDEDFILEDLPKLTITQSGVSYSLEPVSPAVKQGETSVLHLSAKKHLQLNQPLTFSVPVDKKTETVVMNVQQEFWPGYKKFISLKRDAEKAMAEARFADVVTAYEQILSDRALAIFPEFEGVYVLRFIGYQNLLADNTLKFQEAMEDGDTGTKQKIASSEEFLVKFKFVSDNVSKEQFLNDGTKDGSVQLRGTSDSMIERTTVVHDSLNQALDEQTIRWIVLGSSAGKIDFKYKYVIETFAYAYLSVNFADTAASSLKTVVSEDLTARLQKYSLSNSYETFLRVVNKRWKAKEPMFPEGFLENLARDTAQFPLPFYSMLKAVQEFYAQNFLASKAEIYQVMRTCYAYELTERIDQLRILINTIEKNVPMEVLQRIKDGYKAEERGDNDKAIEQYKDAILIAEEYAPAAFALGKLYDRNGDSYTANNFFQKAVTADSQYYTAYRFLYINFFKNANFKPMIDLLTQAINFGNDFFDIHYYLGIAYNGSAQYDLAIQQYERALELNSKSIDANIQAGISYQNMKSYTKARDYFKRAITIDPENQTATDNLKRLDELQKKM